MRESSNTSAARVARQPRRAADTRAAAIRGDRDAKRVAREQQVRMAWLDGRVAAGPALFARAIDLHHALRRGEAPGRGDFLDQCFDVGAEKLEGAVTGLADQVEMPRLAIGMLEPEATSPSQPCGRCGLHSTQRAVTGRGCSGTRGYEIASSSALKCPSDA